MSERLHHDARVDALRQQQTRAAMPEVMQPNVRQVRRLQQRLEQPCDVPTLGNVLSAVLPARRPHSVVTDTVSKYCGRESIPLERGREQNLCNGSPSRLLQCEK